VTPAPVVKATATPAPVKKTVAPAAKKDPMAAKTAASAAPAKKVVAVKPATTHVKKGSQKPATPVAAKPEAPAENAAQVAKAAPVSRNKRDPFQTVIVDRALGGACSSGGKQCLVPDEVALKGIVRSNGSIIAVVTTKENRAYFLRENDPVLNGVVTRITEGSITFREKTTDVFGKQVMREVVKKINPTAA